MNIKYRPIYLLLVVALALSSCVPGAPEQPYVSVETIVAATYAVIAAQTEAARPIDTLTPLPATPTRPPGTATPTPTATFVIASITPTFTPSSTPNPTATNVTSGSGSVLYSCNILSSSPQSVYRVKPKEEFQWIWQVENIGTTRWDPSVVEVRYVGGTQLAAKKAFEISGPAKPGQNTSVKIKLNAPKEPGEYYTTWALKKDIHFFCYVQLEIEVVE